MKCFVAWLEYGKFRNNLVIITKQVKSLTTSTREFQLTCVMLVEIFYFKKSLYL